MRYFSLCSGIEAATVAWAPLGWQPLAFAEIDPFCCALLKHYFPEVPNLGDIARINGKEAVSRCGMPDVIVAGTPCQSFSVAGKHLGLCDPRGNVTIHFLRLVGEIRPQWVVWENVPGVLSIDGGETFRQILTALDEFGYGVAWRVLDAQYFGVPQRRRRVFLVGCLGDWRGAAEVLFGAGSGAWDPAPCRTAREEDSEPPFGCFDGFGQRLAATVSSKWRKGTGGPSGDECQNLVVFSPMPAQNSFCWEAACCVTATQEPAVWRVRRFTPRECERLQGFPDDWTLIPWRGRPASDSQRYKAIGNSMAVPVIRWIGRRIQSVSYGDASEL